MWEENSTAALMKDGEIVASVSEERFSKAKNDERYPKSAIEYVLKAGGVTPSQIDVVAFANKVWKPYYILTRRYSMGTVEDALREQKEYWHPRFYENKPARYLDVFKDKIDLRQYPFSWENVIKFIKKDDEGVKMPETESAKFFQDFRKEVVLKHLDIDPSKIIFTDHHSGHAYYAYYASPTRQDALVFTADAWGDGLNATINIKTKGGIKRIYAYDQFILGRLYRYITLLLGMKPNEHEYKVMGLAPYAKSAYFQSALKIFTDTQIVKGITFSYKTKPNDLYFYFKERFDGKRFDVIAGAVQAYAEELLIQWVKNAIKKEGIPRVCFAGGCAMNVKAMMEINALPEIKELFIPPSPGDESQAIGACYVAMEEFCRSRRLNPDTELKPLSNSYLGPEITNNDVVDLIKKKGLKNFFHITEHVRPAHIARLLNKGRVIGRAAGRSEFGARALGNRTILADPRNPDIIKIINEKIKNRDFWMPFAPTVLEKRARDYFKNYKKCGAPYMTLAFQTTILGRKDLKAACHPADLTSRPQVLRNGQNNKYEEIILAFEKLTGVGGVLNTSFNLHGEPIVQTVKDAYRVFTLSNLDALLLNDTLIEKKAR